MKIYIYLVLLTVVFIPGCDLVPPKIVSDGFEVYRIKGVDSAMALWTSSWSKEYITSKDQLINDFYANEKNFGKFNGYDIIKTVSVGKKYRYCYITLLYEKQPVFAVFNLYQNSIDKWIVLSITWNTDIKEIFPKEIYIE
ncbi:MAG: hypothetical protein JXA06_06195 [Bacteroidetes bacterium]|nr:hypothetical protein [Bacteroidota bacterium]